jgi:hypothetical protein
MTTLLRQQMDFIQVLPRRLIGDLENGQRHQAHHHKSGRYNQRDTENGILRFVWNRIGPICLENWFSDLISTRLAVRIVRTVRSSAMRGVQKGLRTKVSDQSSRKSRFLTTACLLCSSLRRLDLRKERLVMEAHHIVGNRLRLHLGIGDYSNPPARVRQ